MLYMKILRAIFVTGKGRGSQQVLGLDLPRPQQAEVHTRRHHWSWRPRNTDEFRREGGEFRGHRIREQAFQSQPIQQHHPSHILREKWILEQKLFRITRRIQRLNRQLRG